MMESFKFIIAFIIFLYVIVTFNVLFIRNNLNDKTTPFNEFHYLTIKYDFIFAVFGVLCYLYVKKIKYLRTKEYIEKQLEFLDIYSKRNYESIADYSKYICKEKEFDRIIAFQRKMKLKSLNKNK